MPVFEIQLRIFNSCFLYIQLVVTRNEFTTRNLDSSYIKKKYVYEFATINNFFSCKKSHYYIAILLFLCYVFPFASNGFVFPLTYPGILNQNVFFSNNNKKKYPKTFQSILCRMDECNLFLNINSHLFDVLTLLTHHFMLFFSIFSQKKKYYIKRKNNTQSSWMIFCFFIFSVGWMYILRGSLFIKVVS